MPVEHPCAGLSDKAVEAFEHIAINIQPAATKKVYDQLLKRGLIERGTDINRSDRFGSYFISQFYVPLPVHIQWCEWASEKHRGLR